MSIGWSLGVQGVQSRAREYGAKSGAQAAASFSTPFHTLDTGLPTSTKCPGKLVADREGYNARGSQAGSHG